MDIKNSPTIYKAASKICWAVRLSWGKVGEIIKSLPVNLVTWNSSPTSSHTEKVGCLGSPINFLPPKPA